MRATTVFLIGAALGAVGRWAHNEKAVPDAKQMVEIVFALLLISMLDQGRTEPIAKGFAWLFFFSVFLGKSSPANILQSKTLKAK